MDDSVNILVPAYIGEFLHGCHEERSLPRIMISSVQQESNMTHSSRTAFMQFSIDMSEMASLHKSARMHTLTSSSTSALCLGTVHNLVTKVYLKVQSILIESGLMLVHENPAYIRSRLFDISRFGVLSITKSVVTPKTRQRWTRLHRVVLTVNTRLRLLISVLDCAKELIAEMAFTDDDHDIHETVMEGNRRVGKHIASAGMDLMKSLASELS